MNIIKLFFLFSNIFPIFCVEINKPKLCTDCKYFKKDYLTSKKFGKCSFYPIPKYNDYYLVDGSKEVFEYNYHYCSTARNFEHMCGKEGKHFKNKEKKIFFSIFNN